MPQKVVCHKCGKTIFESNEVEPITDILDKYGGKCPYCGTKLQSNPMNVDCDVKPLERRK